MSKQRGRFEAAEKVKIALEHLVDMRPLSEVCDQYGIAPTQFYQWQKQFFEQGAAVFVPKKITVSKEYMLENQVTPLDKLEGRAEAIQAELQRKLIAAREAPKQQRKVS